MAAVEERVRQSVDVEALEALWAAPDTAQRAWAEHRRRSVRSERGARAITWAWIAAIVAAIVFEPTATEPAPWWADAIGTVFFLASLGVFYCGLTNHAALGAKLMTAAAPFALVLGATCGMDSHHAAGWWISETAVSAVLGLAGLAWWRDARSVPPARPDAAHHARQ